MPSWIPSSKVRNFIIIFKNAKLFGVCFPQKKTGLFRCKVPFTKITSPLVGAVGLLAKIFSTSIHEKQREVSTKYLLWGTFTCWLYMWSKKTLKLDNPGFQKTAACQPRVLPFFF